MASEHTVANFHCFYVSSTFEENIDRADFLRSGEALVRLRKNRNVTLTLDPCFPCSGGRASAKGAGVGAKAGKRLKRQVAPVDHIYRSFS